MTFWSYLKTQQKKLPQSSPWIPIPSDSPEDAHGGKGGNLHVGFVNKHRLVAGVRVATGQDLLIELKNFMKIRHGVFQQRQQLREAKVGDLKKRRTEQNVINKIRNLQPGSDQFNRVQ